VLRAGFFYQYDSRSHRVLLGFTFVQKKKRMTYSS
jgi:hypothetical protein